MWESEAGKKPFWKVFHGPTKFVEKSGCCRVVNPIQTGLKDFQRSFISLAHASIRFEWDWKAVNALAQFSKKALIVEKWAKNRWPCFQRGLIKGFRRGGQKVDKRLSLFSAISSVTSYKISRGRRLLEMARIYAGKFPRDWTLFSWRLPRGLALGSALRPEDSGVIW